MSELARTLEALLFLSPEPVPAAELAEACAVRARRGRRGARRAERALRARARAAWSCARSPAAGRCRSAPETEAAARRLLAKPRTPPLTPAQAETLAIVAYLQPVSRPEIDAHPRRQRRLRGRHAARARPDRGGRALAVRRRPVPHDAAVPEALRPHLARRPARPVGVGSRRPRRRPTCATGCSRPARRAPAARQPMPALGDAPSRPAGRTPRRCRARA